MKKLIAAIFVVLAVGFVYAQDVTDEEAATAERTTIRVVVPENQHITDKSANVRIEYEPMYNEARIYYTCLYATYDKGEAMNTVLACLQDFMADNNYYHYSYLARDREHYFKNDRGLNMAEYMSYVRFSK